MTRRIVSSIVAAIWLFAVVASAQQASDRPRFEVASVKSNVSNDGRVSVGASGSRYTATGVSLALLIRNAYRVQEFKIFALVGVGLAVIGIYGVMAYSVAQRTLEIGIRMALGARRAQVAALVVRQSAMLTATGIVLGLVGGAMLSRYLQGLLYGVTPLDPGTFAGAGALFTLLALAAAYAPTRRATRVNPQVALRSE